MRLVIVVIISSISFDIHQKKFYACDLHLIREDHWAGRPTTGAQRYGRMKKDPKLAKTEEQPDAVKSERVEVQTKSAIESRSGKNYLFTKFVT